MHIIIEAGDMQEDVNSRSSPKESGRRCRNIRAGHFDIAARLDVDGVQELLLYIAMGMYAVDTLMSRIL